MKPFKNWLNILASINLIIFCTYWIIIISFGRFMIWYHYSYTFFMFFSSLLAFRKHIELATALQLIGCLIHGTLTFILIGISMAFNRLTFWEIIVNEPFFILEFISFFIFCGIAVVLLILEYPRYKAAYLKRFASKA